MGATPLERAKALVPGTIARHAHAATVVSFRTEERMVSGKVDLWNLECWNTSLFLSPTSRHPTAPIKNSEKMGIACMPGTN